MLEGCIELGLNGSVSIIMINRDRLSNFSEFFSTLLAIFFCISLAIAPFYTLFAGYKLYKAKKDRNSKVIDQLLPIFEGKDLKKALAIQYSTFFFVRRYILMFLFVFFPRMVLTQIYINVSLTLLMLLFVIHVQPFEDVSLNKQEIFNESTVLISSYTILCYTEFVSDQETKYKIGWF